MSEISNHREVIEKIADPGVEVTDEWLEEMAELADIASVRIFRLMPEEVKDKIRSARLEYFDKLGWTNPDNPYAKGYQDILAAGEYHGPQPNRVINSFSELLDQGVDITKLTQKRSLVAAGGEQNKLNSTFHHIKRLGDLAVNVATRNGIEVSEFDVAEIVNKRPFLLHLTRQQLGTLARSLFSLEYPVLSTDNVANDIRNELRIRAQGPLTRNNKRSRGVPSAQIMPVVARTRRLNNIPKPPTVNPETIDEKTLSYAKQLCEYSEHESFQDFMGICSFLINMSSEALGTLVSKVKELYEADEPCTPRVIARLARELG